MYVRVCVLYDTFCDTRISRNVLGSPFMFTSLFVQRRECFFFFMLGYSFVSLVVVVVFTDIVLIVFFAVLLVFFILFYFLCVWGVIKFSIVQYG